MSLTGYEDQFRKFEGVEDLVRHLRDTGQRISITEHGATLAQGRVVANSYELSSFVLNKGITEDQLPEEVVDRRKKEFEDRGPSKSLAKAKRRHYRDGAAPR